MKKKFSAAQITQEVSCEWKEEGGYEVLRNMPGDGYKRSLSRRYLKNLKEYAEGAGDEPGAERRILFLTRDRTLARQGFLILLKQLAAGSQERGEDEEEELILEDGTAWNPLVWVKDPKEQDSAGMVEDILLVSEKDAVPEPEMGAISVEFMGLPIKGQSKAQGKNAHIEAAENVLFEWEFPVKSEKIFQKILKLDNPNIAVWMKPTGDYVYLVKRLSFEGGYQTIVLDGMEREDYLDCGMEYLDYHHFEADRNELFKTVDELMVFRGAHMCEEDVYLHLDRCMSAALKKGRRKLEKEDLAICYGDVLEDSHVKWDRVIGLEAIKTELERQIAAVKTMSGRQVKLYGHMILEGPPGTGKSKMARLYAGRLAEQGIANGRFVDAVKADVVGRYVGQTAYLVKDLFRRAEGGVLFVDEASFLLADDQYVREAIVEFVRYMELYPQTTVIFATYPKEGRMLLDCDPGFASRISRVLTFPSYSDPQLWEILQNMAQDYDFEVEETGREEVDRYIDRIRHRKNFGNAREVRKLLEASIAEFGMREEGGDARVRLLKAEDLRRAGEYLQKQAEMCEQPYGFAGS